MNDIIENNHRSPDFHPAHWIFASSLRCSTKSEVFNVESKAFNILMANTFIRSRVSPELTLKLFFSNVWKAVSLVFWIILILVILSSIGRHLAFTSSSNLTEITSSSIEEISKNHTRQNKKEQIKADMKAALLKSRQRALAAASEELDVWIADLMSRVDDPYSDSDFLDWYFGYWTQQKFGIDAITTWGIRRLNKNVPTVKEKIQESVLQEFTHKVFRPEMAKLELKSISNNISQIYTDELRKNLDKARVQYNIPTAD